MQPSAGTGIHANGDQQPQNPQGLLEKQSSKESVADDKLPKDGKPFEFNEQTNYVPKRTIITVRSCFMEPVLKLRKADSGRSSLPVQASICWLSSTRQRLLPVCIL